MGRDGFSDNPCARTDAALIAVLKVEALVGLSCGVDSLYLAQVVTRCQPLFHSQLLGRVRVQALSVHQRQTIGSLASVEGRHSRLASAEYQNRVKKIVQ